MAGVYDIGHLTDDRRTFQEITEIFSTQLINYYLYVQWETNNSSYSYSQQWKPLLYIANNYTCKTLLF